MILTLTDRAVLDAPFRHVRYRRAIDAGAADRALAWLRDEAPWAIRVESFYEQHEISLLKRGLPAGIAELIDERVVAEIRRELEDRFATACLELADVGAHRLTSGQTIKVHNDFVGDAETHRMLIQLNEGWKIEQGGLLMLFGNEAPESLQSVVMPVHGSGFAFEISPTSFHAVSSIHSGERFTVVYTFRRSTEA